MKIGKFVQQYTHSIFEYCETNDPAEFARLQDPTYSKETFDINFPFCCEVNRISKLDSVRYWKTVYSVHGMNVRVTSQWFNPPTSKSLSLVQTYLRKHCLELEDVQPSAPIEVSPDVEVAPSKPRGRYKPTRIGDAQNLTVRFLLGQIGNETFNKEDWQQVKQDFDNRCAYCGGEDKLVMDHIVPINRTHLGEHRLGNLAPACKACNDAKSSKDFREFLADDPDRIQLIEAHMRRHDYEPMSERDDIKKVVELAYQEVRQVADRYATIIETMLED